MDPARDDVNVADPAARRRITPAGVLIGVVLLVFAVFWIWALFFASKEAINKIGDRDWADRAEEICVVAQVSRNELLDLTRVDPDDPQMLAERAELIDRATDIVEQMVDDVVAEQPQDDKGRAIVPDWEADYRTYLQNRRDYADVLRDGRNEPFRENQVEGVPISERINTFAADNEMPSCSTPIDLS